MNDVGSLSIAAVGHDGGLARVCLGVIAVIAGSGCSSGIFFWEERILRELSGPPRLCVTPSGTLVMRQPCRPGETELDAGTLAEALACPPDSERVGPTCIDTYEATIWQLPAGNVALAEKVRAGQATLADLQESGAHQISPLWPYGAGVFCGVPFPQTFPATGNWTVELYAVSVPGVLPSSCVSWFQAAQACAHSGKHLVTNQEWQRAVAGTPDGAPCKVSGQLGVTGTPGCVSNWGTYDMVGNVAEWVADWIDLNDNTCTTWPAAFGSDQSCVGGPGGVARLSLPAALQRGGRYNSGQGAGDFSIDARVSPDRAVEGVGFRCAR